MLLLSLVLSCQLACLLTYLLTCLLACLPLLEVKRKKEGKKGVGKANQKENPFLKVPSKRFHSKGSQPKGDFIDFQGIILVGIFPLYHFPLNELWICCETSLPLRASKDGRGWMEGGRLIQFTAHEHIYLFHIVTLFFRERNEDDEEFFYIESCFMYYYRQYRYSIYNLSIPHQHQ